MEYTKGRLKILDGTILVIGDEGQTIATLFWVDMPTKLQIGPLEAIANAGRLCLCWNEHDDLVKQRDGLLEACKAVARCAVEHGRDGHTKEGKVVTWLVDGCWIDDLKLAIAEADPC